MVRTNRQLQERMTLTWHDWFATSNAGVGNQRLMIRQNQLLRGQSLGNFEDLLLAITRDPAMLLWLNGVENNLWNPNENYARELMELFTLGEGNGYSERDVREQARALTGFRVDWSDSGPRNFRFDRSRHDPDSKQIFGKRGKFDWQDSCRLCISHRAHPAFFVGKLWGYFIPTPPSASTSRALQSLYKRSGYQVKPVIRAILHHPDFFNGPRMVKPPIVHQAGMLRALGRGVDITSWAWIGSMTGQQLFYPPNVGGWKQRNWLNTAAFRGYWTAASYAVDPYDLSTEKWKSYNLPGDADGLISTALQFWGDPVISNQTRTSLKEFVTRSLAYADARWKREQYPVLTQNALRMLIATSPDYLTC